MKTFVSSINCFQINRLINYNHSEKTEMVKKKIWSVKGDGVMVNYGKYHFQSRKHMKILNLIFLILLKPLELYVLNETITRIRS